MLKYTGVTSFAAGALLILPSVAQEGSPVRSLEQALARTNHALEVLSGYETKLREGSPNDVRSTIGSLLRTTEPATLEAMQRDERTVALRDEINSLQVAYDATVGYERDPELAAALLQSGEGLAAGSMGPIGSGQPKNSTGSAAGIETPARMPLNGGAITGLDERTRALLQSIQPARHGMSASSHGMGEAEGYSADPVRQARACYKAGQYERGLKLVQPLTGDYDAVYWTARMLEMLDRDAEALAAYERAAQMPLPDGKVNRAERDLEFLRWRLDFEDAQVGSAAEGRQP